MMRITREKYVLQSISTPFVDSEKQNKKNNSLVNLACSNMEDLAALKEKEK